jgi:hypothetical protein
VQGGYGTCFCHPGTDFIEHYEYRGTSLLGGREVVPVQDVLNEHWRDRGTSITNLSWLQEQNKNRDKQLTFIVRVRCS